MKHSNLKLIHSLAVLLWICWATIGMGYPLFNAFLPQYLGNNGETPVSIGMSKVSKPALPSASA